MKGIIFDLETTGVDTQKDKIVSIAIKEIGGEVLFKSLINPGVSIPAEASEIHGITDEVVEGAPIFAHVAQQIKELMTAEVIAGYNSNKFDIPLLAAEFERNGFETLFLDDAEFLDVYNLYVQLNPRNLSAAFKHYTGKELDDAHDAASDVDATEEILLKMIEKDFDNIDFDKVVALSNYNKKRADLDGKFYIGEDGDYYFAFGKHKDKKASENFGYLNWMLNADFSSSTKNLITKILTK